MGRNLSYAKELTREIAENAGDLLARVNGLLLVLEIPKVKVTSGWRPASLNAKVFNAAKRSWHTQGKAVDLLDDAPQTLAHRIMQEPILLRDFGLWLEHPEHTKGKFTNWVHLDTGTRQERPIRVFRPFV